MSDRCASFCVFAGLACCVVTGCGQRTDNGLPPVGQHAYVIGAPAAAQEQAPATTLAPSPFADAAPVETTRGGASVAVGAPSSGETTVMVTAEDGLYEIARTYQVDLAWLIQRNDLVRQPQPGQVLVVPRR